MYHQPCYVSYHPSIALAHGESIAVPTFAKDNFALTAEALEAAWQPGAKILMLNLPCNPTGGTCSKVQSQLTLWQAHCSGRLMRCQELAVPSTQEIYSAHSYFKAVLPVCVPSLSWQSLDRFPRLV